VLVCSAVFMRLFALSPLVLFFSETAYQKVNDIFFKASYAAGQFEEVAVAELSALKKACASLDPNYKPKITFIIVSYSYIFTWKNYFYFITE
jgi:hypothetical protein